MPWRPLALAAAGALISFACQEVGWIEAGWVVLAIAIAWFAVAIYVVATGRPSPL